jgi:hypothetical protein
MIIILWRSKEASNGWGQKFEKTQKKRCGSAQKKNMSFHLLINRSPVDRVAVRVEDGGPKSGD